MKQVNIPEIVVSRLPLYLKALSLLEKEGQEITNSRELGKKLGLTGAQVRKDLSLFGKFGKQGQGYSVRQLKEKIASILKADREWRVILIGVGKLGRAILGLKSLPQSRFKIVTALAKDPEVIGSVIEGVEVKSIDELEDVIKKQGIKIAILAVPAKEAQKVANQLVNCNIKAILNYAPVVLQLPPLIKKMDIDPVAALQSMTYYLDS